MRDMGIRLRLGESVAKIELISDGTSKRRWPATRRSTPQTLLYAIGRQGATDKLNLPAAGLTADNRGRLKVNELYQTEVPHIYAAGDVIGFPALAATSMEQGRLAACHMFHQLAEPPPAAVPVRHLHDPRNQHGRPDRAGADRSRASRTKSASPATARSPAASSSPTRTACSSCSSTPRAAACSASTPSAPARRN